MKPQPALPHERPRALRIVILAKAPRPGLAKTRLIPVLGAEAVARLARRLLVNAVEQAIAADIGAVELCVSPAPQADAWHGIEVEGVMWTAQVDGDLGARMADAAQRAISAGAAVLLIGTDSPQLDCAQLKRAAAALAGAEAAMIPALDGGYVLLGLNCFDPLLFSDIAWSTSSVAAETRARIKQLGWAMTELPALQDIDEAADLACVPAAWAAELRS